MSLLWHNHGPKDLDAFLVDRLAGITVRTAPCRSVAYAEVAPDPALAPDVESVAALFSDAPSKPWVNRIECKGTIDLVVPLGGTLCEAAERALGAGPSVDAYVVGPMTRPVVVQSSRAMAAVGLRLRPGAASRLFRTPSLALVDRLLPLSALDAAPGLNALIRRVQAASTPVEGAVALYQGLLELPRPSSASQALVARALACISHDHGRTGVDDLASTLRVTPRQLERAFQQAVGISPKKLCRIARMHQALSLLPPPGAPTDWARFAQSAGFCDQAHLVREFRSLLGTTPGVLLGERASVARAAGCDKRSLRPRRVVVDPVGIRRDASDSYNT